MPSSDTPEPQANNSAGQAGNKKQRAYLLGLDDRIDRLEEVSGKRWQRGIESKCHRAELLADNIAKARDGDLQMLLEYSRAILAIERRIDDLEARVRALEDPNA